MNLRKTLDEQEGRLQYYHAIKSVLEAYVKLLQPDKKTHLSKDQAEEVKKSQSIIDKFFAVKKDTPQDVQSRQQDYNMAQLVQALQDKTEEGNKASAVLRNLLLAQQSTNKEMKGFVEKHQSSLKKVSELREYCQQPQAPISEAAAKAAAAYSAKRAMAESLKPGLFTAGEKAPLQPYSHLTEKDRELYCNTYDGLQKIFAIYKEIHRGIRDEKVMAVALSALGHPMGIVLAIDAWFPTKRSKIFQEHSEQAKKACEDFALSSKELEKLLPAKQEEIKITQIIKFAGALRAETQQGEITRVILLKISQDMGDDKFFIADGAFSEPHGPEERKKHQAMIKEFIKNVMHDQKFTPQSVTEKPRGGSLHE